jgi:hypothetical protein
MCLKILYAVFLILDPLGEMSWVGYMYTKTALRPLFWQKAETAQILSVGGMVSSSKKYKAQWERVNADITSRHFGIS